MAAIIFKYVAKIFIGHAQEYALYEAAKFSRPYMGNYFTGANLMFRMIARALRLRKILGVIRAWYVMWKKIFMIPRVMEVCRELAPGMVLYRATTGAAQVLRSSATGVRRVLFSRKMRSVVSRTSAGFWNFLFTVLTRISRLFYLAAALFERVAGRT